MSGPTPIETIARILYHTSDGMTEAEYKETYKCHRKDFDRLELWEQKEYVLQAREVMKFLTYSGLAHSK